MLLELVIVWLIILPEPDCWYPLRYVSAVENSHVKLVLAIEDVNSISCVSSPEHIVWVKTVLVITGISFKDKVKEVESVSPQSPVTVLVII